MLYTFLVQLTVLYFVYIPNDNMMLFTVNSEAIKPRTPSARTMLHTHSFHSRNHFIHTVLCATHTRAHACSTQKPDRWHRLHLPAGR